MKQTFFLLAAATIVISCNQKKNGENDANIEADMLSRKMVRDTVKEKYI